MKKTSVRASAAVEASCCVWCFMAFLIFTSDFWSFPLTKYSSDQEDSDGRAERSNLEEEVQVLLLHGQS